MMIRIHKDKYILEGFKLGENEYGYVIMNNTLKSEKISNEYGKNSFTTLQCYYKKIR